MGACDDDVPKTATAADVDPTTDNEDADGVRHVIDEISKDAFGKVHVMPSKKARESISERRAYATPARGDSEGDTRVCNVEEKMCTVPGRV